MGQISTYGIVKGVDGDRIVIIDYGLNDDVQKTHYS
jgi:hypothetical protein